MIDKHTRRWIKSMEWFAKYWGCHQMPERSFFIGSYQFPLCARCTGILFGEIAGLLLSFFIPFFWPILLLILPILVDGLTQLWGWRTSNNLLRLITGLLGGYVIISLLAFSAKSIYSLL